jgi:mono/diheme cytochrome c family protein
MKRISSILTASVIFLALASCNSGSQQGAKSSADSTAPAAGSPSATVAPTASKGSDKGIGKFTDVHLTHPLDDSMVARGNSIYTSKCFACHKLTSEKLVGPGWKGVTDRRTPEWIMNFITNTNMMLDSDLVAQQLLVVCTSRMPSQNLSDDQARAVLEFMRKNDGKN